MITQLNALVNPSSYYKFHLSVVNKNNITSTSNGGSASTFPLEVILLLILGTGALCCVLRSQVYIVFKYSWRLKRFRIERERLRQNGQDIGDDRSFERELYTSTFRNVPFDSIDMITGQSLLNVRDFVTNRNNILQISVNYLLDNWKYCKTLPNDSDHLCSICLLKMAPIDSIFHVHSDSTENITDHVKEQILDSDPVQTPCGHIFHEKCIRDWAISHNSCPVCRFQPTTLKDNQQVTDELDGEVENTVSLSNITTAAVVGDREPAINMNDDAHLEQQSVPSSNVIQGAREASMV